MLAVTSKLHFFILYPSLISILMFSSSLQGPFLSLKNFLSGHLHIQNIIIPFILRRCRISFHSGGDPDTTFPSSSSVCKCPDTSHHIWQQFSGICLGSPAHYKSLLADHRFSNEIPPCRRGFKAVKREARAWLSFSCILQVLWRDNLTSVGQRLEICFHLMKLSSWHC